MSQIVVTDAAEEAFLDLILAVNYTLKLFQNDYTPIESSVTASFTEATFTGYSAIALTGGSWTTTQADPTTGVYAQQTFTRSSTGAAQSIYGYYIVTTTGSNLRWAERFDTAVTMELLNDAIKIIPRITLKDEQDA